MSIFYSCNRKSSQVFGNIRRIIVGSVNCEYKISKPLQSSYSSIINYSIRTPSSFSGTLVNNMSLLVSSSPDTSSGATASAAKPRGAFIVFEGIDRCGKTTQCKALEAFIAERNVNTDGSKSSAFFRFPNRESQIGKLINDYLASTAPTDINDNTIHLLFSANRWEQKDLILKTLESGVSIVCDRYAYSGVAFSSAKGMDLDWCKACDRGLPAPDCVLYLDMPVENAAKVDFLF